jgi:NAD(P)-dependent dehydrogenase (short-subunit alcohol dehydrogenase family)
VDFLYDVHGTSSQSARKVAFVTGAGSGIGRTTALAFASESASVLVADVSEQGNQETAHMIEDLGGRALAVRCDVTQSPEVRAALDQAVDAFPLREPESGASEGEPRIPLPSTAFSD